MRCLSTARHGARPRALEVDDVGLDDGDVAQDHVDRREKHLAEPATPDVAEESPVKRAHEALVAGIRRRRHGQLSIVDLVPPPVVRELAVVAVRQENRPIGHTEL